MFVCCLVCLVILDCLVSARSCLRYSALFRVPVISGDTEEVDNLGIRLCDLNFGVLDTYGEASLDEGLARVVTIHLAPDSDATDGHPKRGVGFACLLQLGVAR